MGLNETEGHRKMKKAGKAASKPEAKAAPMTKRKQDLALWTLVVVADLIAILILVKSITG